MEAIRNEVLTCLNEYHDDDILIDQLNKLIEKDGIKTYPVIFHVLTHLELTTREAEDNWREIIVHYNNMKSVLGRKVSLRTAICDYFCSIHKSLINPKVVEIHIFENTLKASMFDSLTGLFNRHYIEESLNHEIARAKRHNTNLTVLFLDIDDFKKINDTYGHQAGDVVLEEVARIIMKEKRAEDMAGRYGGEEMMVILPETDKINGLVLGERIREKVEELKIEYENKTFGVTISGGLATFSTNESDTVNLLNRADNALYRAKGAGKNTISLFSEDKRRYLRFDFDTQIKVRELGFEDIPTVITRSKNIGIGGILFENDYPLAIGAKIQLSIPIKQNTPLIIIGTVARVESFGAHQYDIGIVISFLEMDKAIKKEIYELLKQKKKEQ